METTAKNIKAGTVFTYYTHTYTATNVALNEEGHIMIDTNECPYALGFYPDSMVEIHLPTGTVGFNGFKVHALTDAKDNTWCGARTERQAMTTLRGTHEITCQRCLKAVAAAFI